MYYTNSCFLIYLLIDNELIRNHTSRLIFANLQYMVYIKSRYKFSNTCQLRILYLNDTLILLQFRNDLRHREKIFFSELMQNMRERVCVGVK